MDLDLLAWGVRRKRGAVPRLWLFTDDRRLSNPRASVAALPRGRAGVVLRHDGDQGRMALGQEIGRICRMRRLTLVVAGDVRLAAALHAGVHLRGGRWPDRVRKRGMVTSSAHSVPDLRRARQEGAAVVFLSPAFATASHIGAPGLGPSRWASLAKRAGPGTFVAALGGVTGRSIRRLPVALCSGAGAIEALSLPI